MNEFRVHSYIQKLSNNAVIRRYKKILINWNTTIFRLENFSLSIKKILKKKKKLLSIIYILLLFLIFCHVYKVFLNIYFVL